MNLKKQEVIADHRYPNYGLRDIVASVHENP
jgi:hypothetical protein